MTTIAGFTTATSAILVTDGGYADPRGNMAGRIAKQVLMPHLNAAIAVRGRIRSLKNLPNRLQLAVRAQGRAGFDELVKVAPNVLRGDTLPLWVPRAWRFTDLIIAGIGVGGPALWLVSNHNGHPGVKAFEPFDMGSGLSLPVNDEAFDAAWRIFQDPCGDQRAAVRGLMQALRQTETADVAGRTSCQTTGFVQMTAIGNLGVISEIVGRWPDKIGERVDPTAKLI